MSDIYRFIIEHRLELGTQTVEHLVLTLAALTAAVCVGGAAGLWVSRRRQLSPAVMGLTGVIQTIPSLALLGFLIPLLGIGALPAIVALFLYGLLPIVRNTFIGVTSVDPAVRESAIGMGMTDRQLLLRVELPLALPVIFAGVRTAAVINVGIATLCALIGAGGLGVFIFRGISLNDPTMTLAGALPAAILALGFDGTLALVQRRLSRRLVPLIVAVVLVLGAALAARLGSSASRGHALRVGAPPEFIERADGYRGFTARYHFNPELVEMQHGLMYQALREKRVDAVFGYSTDGEIAAFGLTTLADDLHYFPPYGAAPIARSALLERHPEVLQALDFLKGRIDSVTMSELNARVEHGKEAAASVARAFLESQGFSPSAPRRSDNPDVVIGSKIFAEQYILAEMFASLIETTTALSVGLKMGLGGTQICFEALRAGQIDVYPEYTGTGLLAILSPDESVARSLIASDRSVYDYVQREFRRKYDIEWLAPIGFENSYALVVDKRDATRWNVDSVSDLVARLH